jgi:hypothetical protein
MTAETVSIRALPRWEDLPNLDLYMDQVLTLSDQVLSPLNVKPITAAMINNYVKLKLIPAPIHKRYTRQHVAFILAIAILKDVFEIAQIRDGILLETSAMELKVAYNRFVSEVEQAMGWVEAQSQTPTPQALFDPSVHPHPIMTLAALSFAAQRQAKALISAQGATHD